MRKWCGVRIADFAEHFSQKSKLGKKQGEFGIATFTDATEKQMNIVLMAKDGRRATMDVREKLVELLADAGMGKTKRSFLADRLIAHGVTVQEWISVKDRLPEDGQRVITCKNGIFDIQIYEKRRNGWFCKGWFWSMATVTHWMPLPQLPKGE